MEELQKLIENADPHIKKLVYVAYMMGVSKALRAVAEPDVEISTITSAGLNILSLKQYLLTGKAEKP